LDSWEKAASVWQRALTEAEDDTSLRREIEQGLGYACLFTGDVALSRLHASEALALAEQLRDPVALAESLGSLGFVEFVLGSGIRADLFDRAIALERELEDWPRRIVLRPTFAHAQVLKSADRLDEARQEFLALLEMATQAGHEHPVFQLLYHLAELECRAGNLEAAARYADQAVEGAVLSPARFHLPMAYYASGLVDALLGDVDPARASAEAGLALTQESRDALTSVLNLGALGFLELSLGRPEEALAIWDRPSPWRRPQA
jgi:tetratricopeptide (TPR) repeat protein